MGKWFCLHSGPYIVCIVQPCGWGAFLKPSGLGALLSSEYEFLLACRDFEQMVLRLSQPPPGSKPLAFDRPFPQSTLAQLWICLRKNFVCMWRYPQCEWPRLDASLGSAFCLCQPACTTVHQTWGLP